MRFGGPWEKFTMYCTLKGLFRVSRTARESALTLQDTLNADRIDFNEQNETELLWPDDRSLGWDPWHYVLPTLTAIGVNIAATATTVKEIGRCLFAVWSIYKSTPAVDWIAQ